MKIPIPWVRIFWLVAITLPPSHSVDPEPGRKEIDFWNYNPNEPTLSPTASEHALNPLDLEPGKILKEFDFLGAWAERSKKQSSDTNKKPLSRKLDQLLEIDRGIRPHWDRGKRLKTQPAQNPQTADRRQLYPPGVITFPMSLYEEGSGGQPAPTNLPVLPILAHILRFAN
ncbi:hypothetical protein PtA15_6A365 [Puccinia triticina]|uniref:Uncharacterized protein n=1 Tax=Puccinia triticina TaxID=208348 RepID=A0ABY7CNN8_9BASI|nr:uncharacterized protein PtA15_6A365 [Puccinia triticina]WAQ85736.1 hypothetical protein PtA15_6A365 [Puccinia triticina]